MPGKTRHFGLAYFDYKDRLDTSISVKLERERFITIDEQIHGLYSVFGNGIINGFEVVKSQSEDGREQLVIGSGTIFCRGKSYQSLNAEYLVDFPANSQFYLYADIVGSDINQKNLIIYASDFGSSDTAIRLARCSSINGTISSIDMSYRVEVSFRKIIENEVLKHKHNGTVSKIDLLREVKNSLPGARLGNIDASKVKYGTLKKERIPQLNHNSLKNRGIVTHAGLETLARSLQNVNRQILGEIASVNLLKHSLVLKRKYPLDSDTSVNMITFIPGISSNNSIDFANSSANINLSSGCISGRPTEGGRIASVIYDNNVAFSNFSTNINCSVVNDSIVLSSTISSSAVQFSDSFENASGNDRAFPGMSAESEVVDNNIAVRSDAFNVVSGLFSARFSSGKKDRSVYKRNVTGQKNWSGFNRLFLSVKCASSLHPAVFFYLRNQNADGTFSDSEKVQLLAENEITINPTSQNFKLVEIDISEYIRNNVDKMIFEVTDSSQEFFFFVDDIKTSTISSTSVTYSQSGTIRYRYNSASQVILKQIEFSTEQENGTSVICRFRTGSNIIELLNSTFSSPINSQSVIQTPCNSIEVEFVLNSNIDRSSTPKVNSFNLLLSFQGGENRIELNSSSDWEQGVLKNLEIFKENSDFDYGLRIKTPLENKHIIYSSNNFVQQIKNALPNIPPDQSNISVFGFNGSSLLQSPQQVISSTAGNSARGLDQASSVIRLPSRNYLVSDTYNNRVLEVDRNGNLVVGFGGAFITENATQGDIIPLCANFNVNSRLLQICFDKDLASRENIDISKIKLVFGISEIILSESDVVISDGAPNNVLQIRLSLQKTQIIKDSISQIFVKIEPMAIGVENFNTSSATYGIAYGISGLRLSVSNFTYVKQIFHPISAISYDDDSWIIGNSLVRFDRIRAGIREDIDEFFIPVGEESEFFIIVELSDDLKARNPQVVFLNDQNAANSNNANYEDVIVINSDNIAFVGQIDVSTQSLYTAKVSVQASEEMSNLDFIFKFRVQVKVLDPISNTYIQVDGSPFAIEKRIHIIPQATSSGSDQSPDLPSVIKINTKTSQIDFSFGNVSEFTFSDFTLGGIFKNSDGNLLIGGIQKLPEDLQFPTEPPDDDSFRAQAFQLLKSYRGKMILINPNSSTVLFNYSSPDGLYISDCSYMSNGEILIAESSILQNSGRTIKIDGFGNISFVLSNGQFSIINHARESGEDTILIST